MWSSNDLKFWTIYRSFLDLVYILKETEEILENSKSSTISSISMFIVFQPQWFFPLALRSPWTWWIVSRFWRFWGYWSVRTHNIRWICRWRNVPKRCRRIYIVWHRPRRCRNRYVWISWFSRNFIWYNRNVNMLPKTQSVTACIMWLISPRKYRYKVSDRTSKQAHRWR